jgi:HNH endonuclease
MPKISKKIQKLVSERAYGCCEYCWRLSSFSSSKFPIDHIFPQSLGGSSDENNLANSCNGCNGAKHTKTHHIDPVTKKMSRLYHPRQHKWIDHFQWSEDELTILGVTSIGRATVDLLQVNRLGNVNQRILLKSIGLHPPIFSL